MDLLKENSNVKILCQDPKVFIIDNYLTNEQCDHFIKLSEGNLKRALVSQANKGVVSGGRTGSNYWLKHNTDDITKKVGENIQKLVNAPLENAESYQIIYYANTQEYRNHYDGWLHNGSPKTLRNIKYGGQRLWTALAYLNDVEEGGGTKFTKLNYVEKESKIYKK